MDAEAPNDVSLEEAIAFAKRFGLKSLRQEDMESLRAAMTAIARAGLAVPRVASKLDQPAPVFRVLPQTEAKS